MDKELLELAAKAAGIEIHESDDGTLQRRPVWAMTHYVMGQPYGEVRWNPLHDDAQALRLAVKLHMSIMSNETASWVATGMHQINRAEEHHDGSDPYAATRRAIVRAAAEIGRSMK